MFTTTLARDLEVGALMRFGDDARRAVAVSPVRRGIVTILVDGFGDWQIAEDFPVTVVAR